MESFEGPSASVSFEDLLEELGPRARGVFARYGIPEQDRGDLVQDSLLVFLYKQSEVREPQAWLLGTLRKKCLSYWRRRRHKLYRGVDAAILESLATQAPAQESSDFMRDLGNAVARLPARCRAVLTLRYRQGYEPAETADRLGYKRSGIYKIIERCLASLTSRMVASGLLSGEAQ